MKGRLFFSSPKSPKISARIKKTVILKNVFSGPLEPHSPRYGHFYVFRPMFRNLEDALKLPHKGQQDHFQPQTQLNQMGLWRASEMFHSPRYGQKQHLRWGESIVYEGSCQESGGRVESVLHCAADHFVQRDQRSQMCMWAASEMLHSPR